jgi:hypothetical protein
MFYNSLSKREHAFWIKEWSNVSGNIRKPYPSSLNPQLNKNDTPATVLATCPLNLLFSYFIFLNFSSLGDWLILLRYILRVLRQLYKTPGNRWGGWAILSYSILTFNSWSADYGLVVYGPTYFTGGLIPNLSHLSSSIFSNNFFLYSASSAFYFLYKSNPIYL